MFDDDPAPGQWTAARASEWGSRHRWLCGFNFLPSSAVNFLEMWRQQSFDPAGIDRELGWGAAIGYNALRTNLHYLDWLWDRDGLVARLDQFLDIAAEHGLASMLCLFDDCEFSGDAPQWGPQPLPRPGIHNSRAVGSPGRYLVGRREEWPYLRAYVQDIVHRFGRDPRVLVWDLYNEPGNRMIFPDAMSQREHCSSLETDSHALMRASFAWAREADPEQPLTVAPWRLGRTGEDIYPHPIDRDALALSDVVSFHAYCSLPRLRHVADELESLGRPVFCTEWLARGIDSRIADQLPFFHERRIGAFQWGLVRGRTQTHLPWPGIGLDIRSDEDGGHEWFQDILTEEGLPYSAAEFKAVKSILTAAATGPERRTATY